MRSRRSSFASVALAAASAVSGAALLLPAPAALATGGAPDTGPSSAAGTTSEPGVTLEASVEGRDLATVNRNDPLQLQPGSDTVVSVRLRNTGDTAAEIRSVRLEAHVLGLTFVSLSTRVDVRIAPGAVQERRFPLDLDDLSGQAVGLLPASLSVVDAERTTTAEVEFPVDVRGSLLSAYGVFGLSVAAITGLLLLASLVRLAGGMLSLHRWGRATRLGTVGLGVGLTLTFTLSALRVLVPSASTWLVLVLAAGATGFAAGFLSPTPEHAGPDDDDADDEGRTDGLDASDDQDDLADQDDPVRPGALRA